MDQIFRKSKTVGGSVVVMKDGRLVYARDYGYRNLSRSLPERTYFKMGCVTRWPPAWPCSTDRRRPLDLDEDISRVFGYTIKAPTFPRCPSPCSC